MKPACDWSSLRKITLDLAQLQYINGVIGYMDLLGCTAKDYLDAQIWIEQCSIVTNRITMVKFIQGLRRRLAIILP